MKSVLISIKPKFCEPIASGEKTIEGRRTCPKLETPFKCYIYMTATKERCRFWEYITAYQNSKGDILDGSQKVIGEFVCDRIDEIPFEVIQDAYNGVFNDWNDFDLSKACMHQDDLYQYANGKDLWAWHISDLKIYDKPKELNEFITNKKCTSCKDKCIIPIRGNHHPRTWIYVEE